MLHRVNPKLTARALDLQKLHAIQHGSLAGGLSFCRGDVLDPHALQGVHRGRLSRVAEGAQDLSSIRAAGVLREPGN